MKTLLLAALLAASFGASATTASDFMCGMNRVQLTLNQGDPADLQALVEGKSLNYTGSTVEKNDDIVHRFGTERKGELRVTQKGRVAFRIVGESRWAACIPLVLYREGEIVDEK